MTAATEKASSLMAEAERCVVGSLMTTPSLMGDIASLLNPSDFYSGAHQEIYETLRRLADEGHPTSKSAVQTDMANRQVLERIGGPAYLIALEEAAQSSHALYFAQIVREQAIRRRLHAYHSEGLARVFDGSMPELEKLIDAAHHGLNDVVGESTGGMKRLDDGWLEQVVRLDARAAGTAEPDPIIPTGLTDLDRILGGGLRPGQMVTVAARPGYGKSVFGLDVARNAVLRHGKKALIFTLEMGCDELLQRMISAETRIGLDTIRTGNLTDNQWNAISRRTADVMDASLFIDDTAGTTIGGIRAKAQQVQQRHGLDLIVIDYLQLMTGDGRAESRQQEVSKMSRACKLMAKDLGVPVIVISQLNRGPEQRTDKRPQVSDLRESGAIEQDSDVILLIHREDEADPNSARVGEADIIVGKHRNGPTGVATVVFQGHYSRFVDMAT